MPNKPRLALIYGSTRDGRMCDKVAEWAIEEIKRHDAFDLDIIDPTNLSLPFVDSSMTENDKEAFQRYVGKADAFVVVVPEYNHSFPAPLKALIDSVRDEWQAKPVGFISYGGASGGLRSVEQLRLVFAELHAVGIRDGVSFAGVWSHFDSSGALSDPDRPSRALETMLARLRWWAQALSSARMAEPGGHLGQKLYEPEYA